MEDQIRICFAGIIVIVSAVVEIMERSGSSTGRAEKNATTNFEHKTRKSLTARDTRRERVESQLLSTSRSRLSSHDRSIPVLSRSYQGALLIVLSQHCFILLLVVLLSPGCHRFLCRPSGRRVSPTRKIAGSRISLRNLNNYNRYFLKEQKSERTELHDVLSDSFAAEYYLPSRQLCRLAHTFRSSHLTCCVAYSTIAIMIIAIYTYLQSKALVLAILVVSFTKRCICSVFLLCCV